MMQMMPAELAKAIDHALLKPQLTQEEIRSGCELARYYRVASVCARPADVALCARLLETTNVHVGTVIGFPHGATSPKVKLYESKLAMDNGAVELDVVCNIGMVLSGRIDYVEKELGAIVKAAHERNVIVKVIFENCYLKDEHKIALCDASARIGADYIKTSTGFGESGATLEDIALMKRVVKGACKLKAAGGISDTATALAFIEAGCERIGAGATAAILDGLNNGK